MAKEKKGYEKKKYENGEEKSFVKTGRLMSVFAFLLFALVVFAQWGAYQGLVGPWFAQRREEFILESALPAARDENALFANLELATAENVSLPQAILKINGVECGNFEHGSLLLRVYPGDWLEIDCSAYARELFFETVSASLNLRIQPAQRSFKSEDGKAVFGEITFK